MQRCTPGASHWTNRRAISRLVISCLQAIFLTSGIVTLAAAEKPVILLTGFEPFGEQRPPNPSWEGIAKLNDTEWQGYRLVSLQIPVIWGAPLKELEPRIQQL